MKLKRLIGLALCAALAISMTACKFSTPAVVMTVDGKDIPAGLYLMYQYQAYANAMNLREDRNTAVLKSEIEGVGAAEWIHTETVKAVRRCIWVEQAFDEAGLSFTEEELSTLESRVDSVWDANEALLSANGVGLESYRRYYIAEEKYARLLEEYRAGPDGQLTDADAKAYMDGRYFRAQLLTLPSTDASYNALDEDKQAQLNQLAADLAEQLKAGGSLDELGEDVLKQAFALCGREYSEDVLSNYLTKTFFTEDSTGYGEELVSAVMAAQVGDAGVYDSSNTPIVYQRIVNYEDNDDFTENYRSAIVSEITADAFSEKVEAEAAALTAAEDASAVRTYSPSKVKETV